LPRHDRYDNNGAVLQTAKKRGFPMKKIFYTHWHETEAAERIKPLLAAGYPVHTHWQTESGTKLKEPFPEVFVVSLDRLPSHGRVLADWVVGAKKRQHLPLIFEGGQPDKVAATQAKFPQALYCATGQVLDVLQKLECGKLKYPGATRGVASPANKSAAAKPVKAQKLATANDTFEQLIGQYSPEVQALALRLRKIIYEVLPKAEEKVWATGWKVARYDDGGEITAIGPLKTYVNLYFADGAHLSNPDDLLEGTGKDIRHVKVKTLDGIPVAAIKKLLKEAKKYAKASAERRWGK
jgi:hypothetical protein